MKDEVKATLTAARGELISNLGARLP